MRFVLLIVLLIGTTAPSVAAVPSIRIGRVESEKKCTVYEMTSGHHREAGYINAYGAGYASDTSWSTFLVRDCIDNFASLRTSLQAALASTGKFAIVPGAAGESYVISGHISDVGGGEPAQPVPRPTGSGYAISSSGIFVNMDVTVRDASGRIVYGGLLTTKLETGFNMATQGLASSSSQSGQALYTELQHKVALAVARLVAFKIEPLRVSSVLGRTVQLNYGAPLLQLGTLIQVSSSAGPIVRYSVTGAAQATAQADYYGGGEPGAVAAGDVATVIESDDPAADGRRYDRVDLPQ